MDHDCKHPFVGWCLEDEGKSHVDKADCVCTDGLACIRSVNDECNGITMVDIAGMDAWSVFKK